MSRYKAALSLYVAVAAHLLLILLVTLASGWNPRTPPPQLVAGSVPVQLAVPSLTVTVPVGVPAPGAVTATL